LTRPRITIPIIVALGIGAASTVLLSFIFFGSPSSSDPASAGTAIEHKSTSLIGDLEDDVIWLRRGESKTFNYTLENAQGDTGLMTGFVQLTQGNDTGISSVTLKIGNTSIPSYYHQLQMSGGQLKQIDFIIPRSGSVTFQNNGERVESILLNLQLTYTAISSKGI
jgi:hypothetical protein